MNTRFITYYGIFDTSQTTLYTCPIRCQARVSNIGLEFASGSDVVGSVFLYVDRNNTTYTLLNARGVPIVFYEHDLILKPNDRIEILAGGTTPVIHGTITLEEKYINNG